jgi:hypothetical protein
VAGGPVDLVDAIGYPFEQRFGRAVETRLDE